jgi:site-specific DNA-methyltransferase (adenine-specific)
MTFYKGDAIELMKGMEKQSIDLIYINPPFNGATKNKWDSVIDWTAWFAEADRILKPTGNIVIHCAVPFNYQLIRQAPRPPSYSWYWKKENTTLPFIAKTQPMRCVEEVLVWRGPKGQFFPQRVGTEKRKIRSNGISSYYNKAVVQEPQEVIGKYQNHFMEMAREIVGFSTRPRKMIEMMYNAYSKEGDTVLDCFCNDGFTSQCCPGRQWIGVDLYHEPTRMQ